MQNILTVSDGYSELDEYYVKSGAKTILLVCDGALQFLQLNDYFNTLEARKGIRVVKFRDFEPNPRYESVVAGIEMYQAARCEMITAVGGGSAIDVAKCIKLFCYMNDKENYLKQEIKPNTIPLLAIPTTAGTGSEATRYAVIYYNGEKQSITHESCIPETVLFDASVLKTLSIYQKKATMMDAFCHAIESFWSVNSTDESKEYSKKAIRLIIENMDGYLANTEDGNRNMLKAANNAGKAINITQTTAGHAMCYKLTSLYGIAHGHAAALCVSELFPYMIDHIEDCIDNRGTAYLESVFSDFAKAMGCDNVADAAELFRSIVDRLDLGVPKLKSEQDIDILKNSVNPVRLKNHPVILSKDVIEELYTRMLKNGKYSQ